MPHLYAGPVSFALDSFSFFNPANTAGIMRPHRLGEFGWDRQGNRYRWALAGAADLIAGTALQCAVPVADNRDMAVAADAAIGARSITVTLGATAVTAGQYAGGYLFVTVTPGNGFKYPIKSHPAAAGAAACIFTLDDECPVQVALTAAGSKVTLVANEYAGVIITPVTTLTGAVIGGAAANIPATYEGWIQDQGLFNGLIVGTPAVGASLSCPTSVAGAFAINSGTLPIVGRAEVVGIDGKNSCIKLLAA